MNREQKIYTAQNGYFFDSNDEYSEDKINEAVFHVSVSIKNMKITFTVLLFSFLFVFSHTSFLFAAQNSREAQVQADDLVLPMPGGGEMVFRPVCMGAGDDYYAWKRFRVGDPAGGYKESPTGVALGGAFRVKNRSGEDWCYYMGKYEVTEEQFATVMHEKIKAKKAGYPVTNISWFEATDFIRKYSDWLYKNATDKIPAYGGIPGYLRLPTEFEWEFAARGGSRVNSAQFDRKTPYPAARLADYEWFSGPKSSHNKVQKVGLLKGNPLGLHDMLGNVAEMTRTLYQIEYYQGRSGGFVAKGGHYLTDGKRIRSSMRTEQEFYHYNSKTQRLTPAKKATLGFRVVLSSLVFPNRQVVNQMKKSWKVYREGSAQSLPAAVSTGSTSVKTKISENDAAVYLSRLKNTLTRSGAMSADIQQEIDNLGSSIQQIQFTIRQAEKDSAYAWIKIAAEQAFFVTREARKLPILHELEKSAKVSGRQAILKKYEVREKEIQQNISQAMSSYVESIRQLGSSGESAFEDGINRYRQFLTKRKAQQQILLLTTVRKHALSYLKNKRTNDEEWKKALLTWSASSGASGSGH